MMTRKDYIKIADVLRTARNRVQNEPLTTTPADVLLEICDGLVSYMSSDNDGFNEQKFMYEAGLKGLSDSREDTR